MVIGNWQLAIDGRYIQDHFPGIGRYTFNLIDALARVASDERFVVLYNPALANTRYDLASLARQPNIELRRVDIPTFSLREQIQFPISNFQFLHSPYIVKPYFLRVPSLVTIFDLIPLYFPNDMPNARARIFYRLALELAAQTATRVLAPSHATRDDLIARLRVSPKKIVVMPLAADARFVPQAQAEIARVREKYNLPARFVLTVGINKPHKNHATLQLAIANCKLPIPLVIAGAFDARYAAVSGQSSAVTYLYNIADADLPALYAACEAFVFPSLYEGFGLPPLEAMACGAPVICSNASSLPEVVGDPSSGSGQCAALTFAPRDVDALSAHIARVWNDAGLRDELRAKSLARTKQFSWERCARETLQVYRHVRDAA